MGYYIELPKSTKKAQQLVDLHKGVIVPRTDAEAAMVSGEFDVVVVMENGAFDAAGFMFSMDEFLAFADDDSGRRKHFVLLDKGLGAKLSRYTRA